MKYDANKHKYAVIQSGYALFGVGETREQAIINSIEWIEVDGVQGGGTFTDIEKMLCDENNYKHGDFIITSNPEIIKQYISDMIEDA